MEDQQQTLFEQALATDIQTLIWLYLDPIDLCVVSLVCRSFQQTSSTDKVWKRFSPTSKVSHHFKGHFVDFHRQYFNQLFQSLRSSEKSSPHQQKRPLPFLLHNHIFRHPQPSRLPAIFESYHTSQPTAPKYTISLFGRNGVGKSSLVAAWHTLLTQKNFFNDWTDFFGDLNIQGEQDIPQIKFVEQHHNANAFIICYDVSDPLSFISIYEYYLKADRSCPIFLVGTKYDLPHLVRPHHAEALSQETAIHDPNVRRFRGFFKTSTFSHTGIKSSLQAMAKTLFNSTPFVIPPDHYMPATSKDFIRLNILN